MYAINLSIIRSGAWSKIFSKDFLIGIALAAHSKNLTCSSRAFGRTDLSFCAAFSPYAFLIAFIPALGGIRTGAGAVSSRGTAGAMGVTGLSATMAANASAAVSAALRASIACDNEVLASAILRAEILSAAIRVIGTPMLVANDMTSPTIFLNQLRDFHELASFFNVATLSSESEGLLNPKESMIAEPSSKVIVASTGAKSTARVIAPI